MASDLEFVQFVCDQIGPGRVIFRKMFGEYALYMDSKVVALVCDNQVFLKPTEAGRALLGNITEAPPYPGARPYFLLDDIIEDAPLLEKLMTVTADTLPFPPPKKPKKPKTPGKRIKD